MTTGSMTAGQLAAIDRAAAAYRVAAVAFASMTGTGQELRAAEGELRRAGLDQSTGLITLPIAAVHFTDERRDGARMAAVCGGITGGRTWICWRGRCFRHGVQCDQHAAYDLIQVKA